jgi:hypothetical protein
MPADVPLTAVIGTILSHTPLYVWAILAGLIVLGSVQSRTLRMSRTRLLIAPAVLAGFAAWGVASTFGARPAVMATWLLGITLALVVNHKLLRWPRDARFDGEAYIVAGSPWPLVLMLATFALRYAIAVTLVFHPDWRSDAGFDIAMALLYGALSGLFVARAARILISRPRARVAPA